MLLVSHDRALLDAVAERTLAIEDGELHSYDGGWAEMLRRREERSARAIKKPEPKVERKRKPAKPAPKRPSELEQIEAEIAAREAEVADLERRLASDWSDVETLAAHKQARDSLQSLLTRWEDLFEKAQT
jgi:ATPase subunit of ABC transporter with duplicated ATPase domains